MAGSARGQQGQKGRQGVGVGQGEEGEARELQHGKQEAEEKDPENENTWWIQKLR